jgi:SAM-dependent methyltransferase
MTSYGFEQEKPERLAGIEATWDPGTRALLESLGVGPGRRCLEAGAGGGSIAAWMAERVAPGGSVLATDIDTQYLDPLSGGALEVRQHDLTRDELPLGAFDVVHARSVMSWLGSTDAWERLVGAVAPGGWLVVEDFDWAIGGPSDGRPQWPRCMTGFLAPSSGWATTATSVVRCCEGWSVPGSSKLARRDAATSSPAARRVRRSTASRYSRYARRLWRPRASQRQSSTKPCATSRIPPATSSRPCCSQRGDASR